MGDVLFQFGSLAIGVFGPEAVRVVGEVLKKAGLPEGTLARPVQKAFSCAVVRFRESYPFEEERASYDAPMFSGEGNLKVVLETLFLGAKHLDVSNLAQDHLTEEQTTHLDEFMTLLEEEMKKDLRLAAILATKAHFDEQTSMAEALRRIEKVLSERFDHLAVGVAGRRLVLQLYLDQPTSGLDSEHLSAHLRPYNDFIPLLGRDEELTALETWRDAPRPLGWLVVVGAGGMGKTRLAHEFTKDSRAEGWLAGFIDEPSLSGIVGHPDFLHWKPECDTLLVVDYADGAEKQAALAELLLRLARWSLDVGREPRCRVRVLLLARQGSAEEGWVADLKGKGEGAAWGELAATSSMPLRLLPPGAAEPKEILREIVVATFAGWASVHPGMNAPDSSLVTEEHLLHLGRITEGKPLFVQTAAWRACEAGDVSGLGRWEQKKLLDFAVNKERRYINKLGLPAPLRELVERGVALLTVLGSRSRNDEEWLRLLGAEAVVLGYAHTSPGEIAAAILRLYGKDDEDPPHSAAAIGPDLLAEAFTVGVLQLHPGTVCASLGRALRLGGVKAWEKFLLLVVDLAPIESYEVVLGWLDRLAAECSAEELTVAARGVPWQTVVLSEFALTCAQAALSTAVARGDEGNQAQSLALLGSRYSALGRREEALVATERAVAIYERLAARQPDAFQHYWAGNLSNLGNRYAELGRREEALAATEQAVAIHERLAARQPDAFDADLARSLNNLGSRYGSLGRQEEALAATERAVAIHVRLAARQPDAFQADLAGSLSNLGSCYAELGRREEALVATERAVAIHERLAARQLDAFEPDLALSLKNLGSRYASLGRREGAFAANERAVEIYERLAARQPDAFEPDLGRSLNNLSVDYASLGRREEARAVTERAVAIYERLAARHAEAFEPDLAIILSNLSVDYASLGRREEALVATERAVAIYERLAARQPDAFEAGLARSLNNQGAHYSALGRRGEALAATERAVAIYERLAARQPDAFEPDLGRSLGNLGNCYSSLGRREEGLAANEVAVAIFERLAARHAEAFEPDLAKSLNNLGALHRDIGRREEALAVHERAVEIYERLAAREPDAIELDLARTLGNVSVDYSDLGRREKALAANEVAVAIFERLAARHAEAFEPDLAKSLNNLGALHRDIGRREEAFVATERAVEIYERLAARHAAAFEPDLANALLIMSGVLRALGEQDKAQQAEARAGEILARR